MGLLVYIFLPRATGVTNSLRPFLSAQNHEFEPIDKCIFQNKNLSLLVFALGNNVEKNMLFAEMLIWQS